MLPGKVQPESWREALKFIGRCPICGNSYQTDTAKWLAKHGPANLVHLTCSQCASGFVAMVMVGGNGLSSVGMVTDLNYEDSKRLQGAVPITLDEVISGYEYLKQNWY